ncbi:MAG: ACT domain-containing protein [Victivallales bacterium]|nr:ACT domain-containing protein [Victivallales bacterium]
MNIKQLSLFIENKSGTINKVCQVLKKHNINIYTLSLADTEQFGIMRLLVRDWEYARKVLAEAGFIANVTEVLALAVADEPGGLADLLEIMARHDLNVEYMYAFTSGRDGKAIMIFRFEHPEAALAILAEENIKAITSAELYH